MKNIFIVVLFSLVFVSCGMDINDDDDGVFTITSASYSSDGIIPEKYSCDGANISPHYRWSSAPTSTDSFVLILDDESTPGCSTGTSACRHWALYNIPSNINSIKEDFDPNTISGVAIGDNYKNKAIYAGPCPPTTDQHIYKTTIYALDTTTTIASGTAHTRASFEAAFSSNILSKATYQGRYK